MTKEGLTEVMGEEGVMASEGLGEVMAVEGLGEVMAEEGLGEIVAAERLSEVNGVSTLDIITDEVPSLNISIGRSGSTDENFSVREVRFCEGIVIMWQSFWMVYFKPVNVFRIIKVISFLVSHHETFNLCRRKPV